MAGSSFITGLQIKGMKHNELLDNGLQRCVFAQHVVTSCFHAPCKRMPDPYDSLQLLPHLIPVVQTHMEPSD